MKRCPFCGSDKVDPGEVLGKDTTGEPFTQAGCQSCGACGPVVKGQSSEKAEDLWNARAEE